MELTFRGAARWISIAAGLAWMVACVLLIRRCVGGFGRMFSEGELATFVFIGVLAVSGFRWLFRSAWKDRQGWLASGLFSPAWLTTCAALWPLHITLGVSLPLLAFLLAGEGVFWFWLSRPETADAETAEPPASLEVFDGEEEFEEAPPLPAHLCQQITRGRQADGSEMLTGVLAQEFSLGQQQGRLHLPFCPPLKETPQVFAESLEEDVAVQVELLQAETFGACWELRLDQPARRPRRVQVRFFISTSDEG